MTNIIIFENLLIFWLISFFITLIVFILLKIVLALLTKRLQNFAVKTSNSVDDLFLSLITNTKSFFLFALSLYVGSKTLNLLPGAVQVLNIIVIVSLWLQVGIWAASAIKYWLIERNQDNESGKLKTNLNVINTIGKIAIWSIVLILILDSIPSIQVTALITSLGIGGIAVGLAVQNILEDLFSSVSIALDKPFMIGDFISVDEFSGSVEHIGLKSTRLRSVSGEQLIFSNSDLLNARIKNFKRMERRRVVIKIGVPYQTKSEILKIIPEIIKNIVTSFDNITFERANLTDLGDFSINFEFSYFVETDDFQYFMDTREQMIVQLYDKFSQENIEFAYPTQNIFIKPENQQE